MKTVNDLSVMQRRQLMADWYEANDAYREKLAKFPGLLESPPNQRRFTEDWIRRNS